MIPYVIARVRPCNDTPIWVPHAFLQASMVLHVLALTIDSHGREIISCDTQVWILKITDATGIWASVSVPRIAAV